MKNEDHIINNNDFVVDINGQLQKMILKKQKKGVCPVVISTIPTNGATNVPFDQVISVTFNEEMNANTINNVTFTVTGSSVDLRTIVFQGTTATLTPDSP
ncbi:MAG: Ig-like domain-containing protein [Saprospiraceae bacterium]|nr:Ig-like domain-containing protein [Saprospiraceae bacterium]